MLYLQPVAYIETIFSKGRLFYGFFNVITLSKLKAKIILYKNVFEVLQFFIESDIFHYGQWPRWPSGPLYLRHCQQLYTHQNSVTMQTIQVFFMKCLKIQYSILKNQMEKSIFHPIILLGNGIHKTSKHLNYSPVVIR